MVAAAPTEVLAVDRSEPFALGVERRFPLDLSPTLDDVWPLYQRAKVERWDPEDPGLWAGWAPESYPPDDVRAAALVWSSRAWLEFNGMAESEALLIRFCLELEREADAKFLLSMRGSEKARSTDACFLLAKACGGYRSSPPSAALARLLDADLTRRALDPRVPLDGYVAAHLCLQGTIDLALWQASTTEASDPVVRRMGELVGRDKQRQRDFAWTYLAHRAGRLDDELRAATVANLEWVLGAEELAGLRIATLLPEDAGREELLDAQRRAAHAGLGALLPDAEVQVLREAVGRARALLANVGLDLPPVDHPALGEV